MKSRLIFKPMGAFWREAREKRGLSQTEVAEHLGVKPQFVSANERGFSAPPILMAGELCNLYRISKEAFIKKQLECHKALLKKELRIK